MRRCYLDSLELAHVVIDTILDKKGYDIILLDLREQAVFADYFLICSADSDRQLRALAEGIRQDVKEETGVLAYGTEGEARSGWVLVDYGDLVVHLFGQETRHYYDLEGLWREAHVVLQTQ